jgi:hypothetical protein
MSEQKKICTAPGCEDVATRLDDTVCDDHCPIHGDTPTPGWFVAKQDTPYSVAVLGFAVRKGQTYHIPENKASKALFDRSPVTRTKAPAPPSEAAPAASEAAPQPPDGVDTASSSEDRPRGRGRTPKTGKGGGS